MSRRDDDLNDELRAHLDMAARDRIASGESPSEARANARRELGNELLIKETTRAVWGWSALERILQDLRYALRQIRRDPGFTAVTILTLALGLGATTAMFSIVNGVLLQPLAFPDPDRLYVLRDQSPLLGSPDRDFPINARHFHEWRTWCESCASIALATPLEMTLIGGGQAQPLPGLAVSFDFFRTLGVQPALGRDFMLDEELPGNFGKVILTDALWRTRFAADPDVVGRDIQINGEAHTVVGVLPPGLHLPKGEQWDAGSFAEEPLIFRPLGFDVSLRSPSGSRNYISVLRLKPGLGAELAAAELNARIAGFKRDYNLDDIIVMFPLHGRIVREVRNALWLLLASVGAVLLIVCVNVANLILVRAAGRDREAGIRLALGARRARLFGMIAVETGTLVGAGSTIGWLLAQAGIRAFIAAAPVQVPRLDEIRMDLRVLAFATGVAAVCTLLCALFPSWRLAKVAPLALAGSRSRNASAGRRSLRVREGMVAVEVGLSTLLLVGGGLLITSFTRLMREDRGFVTERVVIQDVSFRNPKYAKGAHRRFVEEILPVLRAIPGVQSAGAVSQLPLRGSAWGDTLRDPDQPEPPPDRTVLANFRFATPGYFEALGISLVQGRFLNEADRERPVAVVSQSAARYLWPGRDPLGRHVRGASADGQYSALEVVGVVADTPISIEEAPLPMVYQHYWPMQPIRMSFALRTEGDASGATRSMRALLRDADPDLALPQALAMQELVDSTVAGRRFQVYLTTAFALAALLLAALGVYGVISFSVAQRTPEIGIRMALGAHPWEVISMIAGQGMRPVLAGLIGGLASALGFGRFIASELYGITPYDPLTIAAAGAVLLSFAFAACWIPARRASGVDPLHALRFE